MHHYSTETFGRPLLAGLEPARCRSLSTAWSARRLELAPKREQAQERGAEWQAYHGEQEGIPLPSKRAGWTVGGAFRIVKCGLTSQLLASLQGGCSAWVDRQRRYVRSRDWSREKSCGILERCAIDFSQLDGDICQRQITVTWAGERYRTSRKFRGRYSFVGRLKAIEHSMGISHLFILQLRSWSRDLGPSDSNLISLDLLI